MAVFDIDGTLTDTTALDDRCYVAALHELFGLPGEPAAYDWATCRDVSDSGALVEVLRDRRGQGPTPAERTAFERRFLSLLRLEIEADPDVARAIRGARELLAELAASPDWIVALATGGFEASARLKLGAADLEPPGVLVASDRLPSRVDIVRDAIARASSCAFAGIVAIGDGVWDAKTAGELGLPFVGVGAGAHAEELTRLGARAVVTDFGDPIASERLLRETALAAA